MARKQKLKEYEPDKLYKITWHASKTFKGSEVEEKLKVLSDKKIIHWIEELLSDSVIKKLSEWDE